ncbi:putative mitochondrial branched-chain amino acid aminotransferase [Leptomonas pyrrhocoris]|uniref:Branched-chain-amino-acid aminotransferase n=1 Tax=Leptomonas pyrrhocoris TaxID=157538 RepID=A0A0M9G7N8_LEPPY|nr:putative mitochondrial branched-chain amino acid aminotransferase [Leptomonas pyrrhocoris]XP_015662698.1 putative mitochondrial branched-chain amino acid aminotransferase [Leptomonas pyrrhocoris]KPA84257.1 putative mitochondrial branched-chain amino acid aminotransferase [Leptomonas pyrrhocoris]KPA84259.1 putative mitochondrial branched-chain amino acid aminotransferase [Leptomonas pyrrhocoris]|eukprot:XP_015662696.1 putative mitochondrial branched-chain amino acid aminotransferase [Leptomonas pyrrhocoris]
MSFKAADITKTLTENPPPLPPMKGVAFGTVFTPHMVIIDYADGKWGAPQIVPFANFSLPPQTSCFHYATECFEGMKAYADIADIEKVAKGEKLTKQHIRLFRPDKNVARLQDSMHTLCMPPFDATELVKVIEEFVRTERDYVPKEFGYSLYLRPTAIGTAETLSVVPSSSVRLFVIASPVGPYYPPPEGESGSAAIKPVKLLVEEKHKRAWPGGTGGSKLGANYAGPMLAQEEAHERGYDQVLWLGAKDEVQEVGSMNFFTLWKTKAGKTELITAPLDGTILPGVTRASILELARGWGEFEVSERSYFVQELVEALQEGRVIECFGCGTAAIVSPVNLLAYRGKEYAVPCPENSITRRFLHEILDIQYGKTPSPWSVEVIA